MRKACIVASVPVLERRTFSTPVRRTIRSATWISKGVVQAKSVPSRIASATRSTTGG